MRDSRHRFALIMLTAIATGALPTHPVAAELTWFEGHWHWHRGATIEAMSQGSEQAREAARDVLPNYDSEWIVDSGTVTIINDDESHGPINYFVRPINDHEFELIVNVDGVQHYSIIRRVPSGFCHRWGGDYSEPPMPKGYESCYTKKRALTE